MTSATSPDLDVVAALLRRDERAFVDLVTRYQASMKRIVPFSSLAPAGETESEGFAPDRFLTDGHWATPPRPFEAPADRMALLEFRARLREALVHLPERQQVVVTLRDVEGLAADEVCNLLDLSEANQRVILHRARSRVRANLETYLEN